MLILPAAGAPTLASALSSLLLSAVAALSPGAVTAPAVVGADSPAAPATALSPVDEPAWVAPVAGTPVVLAPFDPPAEDWMPGHRGVDLAAPAGTPVLAAGHGMVVFEGPVAGRGILVVLHDDGRRTTYSPVTSTVSVGDEVEAGDPIGVVSGGADHCRDTCLHWGLRLGDAYFDPMSLLRQGRPALLPLGP